MIDLHIVREQYQQMPDEELTRFAMNESEKLTIESFHALKEELESRHLDLSIMETVDVERRLVQATEVSVFEKSVADVFTRSLWQHTFDEKFNGASNEEIFNSLLKKKIEPQYAYVMLESLKPAAVEILDDIDTEIVVGWLLLILGCGLLFFITNGDFGIGYFVIWAIILTAAGIIRLIRSYTMKNKYQVIIKNIDAEEEIQKSLFQ